jgi:hypothetical protein
MEKDLLGTVLESAPGRLMVLFDHDRSCRLLGQPTSGDVPVGWRVLVEGQLVAMSFHPETAP